MEKLNDTQISELLKTTQDWTVEDNCLCKTFTFKNFKEAFAFMTAVAFEAEAQEHHPDWTNVYNRVSFKLNTHDAGGLTEKDFTLAKTIDALA